MTFTYCSHLQNILLYIHSIAHNCTAWQKLSILGLTAQSYVTYTCHDSVGCTYLEDTDIDESMKDLPEQIAPTLRSNMTMRQYYSWLWNGQQTFNVSGITRKMRRTVCSAFDTAEECNQHCTVACHEETDPEKRRFTATLHSLPKTQTDISFQSYLP